MPAIPAIIPAMTDEAKFGCEGCWPAEAGAAWKARDALDRVAELVDESHFGVRILACPRCAQRFVWIFTETIDWVDGEDPQYCTLLPLTEAEAAELTGQGASTIERKLAALGPGRRSLRSDFPKGKPRRIHWGKGLSVWPHD